MRKAIKNIFNKENIIIAITLFVSVLLRIQNLSMPIGNDIHAFRQTETAIVIQNYFRDGWSLLHYQMPVLGQPWIILFECPIYQTIVYAIMKVFRQTDIDLWCRIVSLITFYFSVFFLKKLTELITDRKVARCVCIVYLFSPFTILWSRAALIDYMSVLFALIYCNGVYSWLINRKSSGKMKYFIALVFGSAAYLLKTTTMFPYVYLLAFFILDYLIKCVRDGEGRISFNAIKVFIAKNIKNLVLLAILCIVPVIFGIAWTYYADLVRGQSIYTAFLTSERLKYWNYGTMEQKLDFSNWMLILRRLLDFAGGSLACAFLFVSYFLFRSKRYTFVLASSLISIFLTIGTLFNLYYVHNYYLIALSPIMAICLGIMLSTVIQILSAEGNIGKLLIGALCTIFVFMQIQNDHDEYLKKALNGSLENESIGLYINQITNEDERILIEGEDWSPRTLYYANRKGFMLTTPVTDEFYQSFLKEEYYTTLLAHSVDYVEEFSNYQDILIQYPKEDVYVYKFFDETTFSNCNYPLESIQISAEQNEYNVENPNIDIIKIEYDESLAGRNVQIVFSTKDGSQYTGSCYLLKSKNAIYYKVGALLENTARFG